MKRLNPAYVTFVFEHVSKSPYFNLISMPLTALTWGECRLELVVQEKHTQPFGTVHGGVCASLVDAASFWAVFSQLDEGLEMTTVELKLNYLAPISEGRLIAKGRAIKTGNTICLGEASVEDEKGRLIAHGTSTMMILRGLNVLGKSKMPRKFLDEEERDE
jgi:uncharacterized protein (TIGR00369 family)